MRKYQVEYKFNKQNPKWIEFLHTPNMLQIFQPTLEFILLRVTPDLLLCQTCHYEQHSLDECVCKKM